MVLPSKLTNILAVGGNAVISAATTTTLGILCEDFPEIAVLVEPESAKSLVTGIEKALSLPIPNRVAQSYAKKFLNKDIILKRFFSDIA